MDWHRPDDRNNGAIRDRVSGDRFGALCRHGPRRFAITSSEELGAGLISRRRSHQLITAGTGVFDGFEKEELVQALGLSFSVSTIALAVNVGLESGLHLPMAKDILVALAFSCVGMWVGQSIRLRLSQAAYRRSFLVGLLTLGIYLVVRRPG
jgi:hypothetical protein